MSCINCGKENKDGAAFCTACGKPLASSSQPGQSPAQVKPGKGLIIGLIAANAVLIAAAVVLIVLLTAAPSVEGLWCSESEGDVLAFTDDGTVDLYKIDGKLSGDYEYQNGAGEFSILDSDFDFKINGDMMEIDKEYEYERVVDEDFDIFAFVNMYTVVSTGNTNAPENTPVPIQTEPPQVAEPTAVLTPVPTQVSETLAPADPTVPPEQNKDAELMEKMVLYTWYGHYKYANDGTEVYKTESDYYEFYEDGTFIYQYAGDGDILYGVWKIENEQLTVVYENSEIGEVTWEIAISIEEGHQVLYFFDIRSGYEGGYWIYADIPV